MCFDCAGRGRRGCSRANSWRVTPDGETCVCVQVFSSFRDFFLLPSFLPESKDATLSFPLFRVTSSLLFFTAVSGGGTL